MTTRRALVGAWLLCACAAPAWAVVWEGGWPGAAKPAGPAAPAAAAVLAEIPQLAPLDQIARVKELAAADPAARALAAVVADPALLEPRRAELAAAFGESSFPAVAALSVALQFEAHADARIGAGLKDLARASLGKWYDGSAPPAQPDAVVEPALVTPARPDPAHRQRVLSLTSQDGRLLVNGRPAEEFREPSVKDSVVKEMLVHPDDPGLLLRVYHSRDSLDGFERMDAAWRRLDPLSQAGAAPRLIEQGEAPIRGLGRVYFIVQERLRGKPLAQAGSGPRLESQVESLFERLARAGLALVAPEDPTALPAQLAVGATDSEGEGAYVLTGTAVRKPSQAVGPHYEMLRAMLRNEAQAASAAARPGAALRRLLSLVPESRERDALIAKAPPAALAELGSGEVLALLALGSPRLDYGTIRADVWGKLSHEDAVRLVKTARARKDEGRAAAAARWWLAAKVAAGEAVSLEQALALARLVGEGAERDELILSTPRSAYGAGSGARAAELLGLVSLQGEREPGGAVYERIPAEAWRAMTRADLEALLAVLVSERQHSRTPVMGRWLAQHLETLESAELAQALWAFGPRSAGLRSLPGETWLKLELDDARALAERWKAAPYGARLSGLVAELWLGAHAAAAGSPALDGPGLLSVLSAAAESKERDAAILGLPAPAFEKLGPAGSLAILELLGEADEGASNFTRLPAAAWKKIPSAGALALARRWLDGDASARGKTVAAIVAAWSRGREAELPGLIESLPPSAARDAVIAGLPGDIYAAMGPEAAAELLQLAGDKRRERVLDEVADDAWLGMSLRDAERLGERGGRGGAKAARKRWLAAQVERHGPAMSGYDLQTALKALPASAERDQAVLRIPGYAYAAMDGSYVVPILGLIRKDEEGAEALEKLPPEAWLVMSQDSMRNFAGRWKRADQAKAALRVRQLWLEARK